MTCPLLLVYQQESDRQTYLFCVIFVSDLKPLLSSQGNAGADPVLS